MHGLVSLLDQKHTRQVEELWKMLEEECGLTGIQVTPFPHFSWLIASDFDWPALENVLQEITSNASPFTVHTTGLGLFSGPNPVIFVPVVKSARLNAFHQQVWNSIQSLGTYISPLYAPDNWVPHISLAYADVTQENITCVMKRLAFRTYNWEIRVDNISFIHEPDDHIGEIRYEFKLKGNK